MADLCTMYIYLESRNRVSFDLHYLTICAVSGAVGTCAYSMYDSISTDVRVSRSADCLLTRCVCVLEKTEGILNSTRVLQWRALIMNAVRIVWCQEIDEWR